MPCPCLSSLPGWSLPAQPHRLSTRPLYRCPALQLRPLTHDLMKNTLEVLGFRVTKVRITALVGNTYHARVHYARGRGPGKAEAGAAMPAEVDVDARPSGARWCCSAGRGPGRLQAVACPVVACLLLRWAAAQAGVCPCTATGYQPAGATCWSNRRSGCCHTPALMLTAGCLFPWPCCPQTR